MNTGDTGDIKKMNLRAVFEIVRYHGPVSQPEIKEMTNLTATTILTLLEELKKDNLIFEHEYSYRPDGINKKGRPPKYFSLKKNGRYVLGLSLKDNYWGLTVLNLANEVCLYKKLDFIGTNPLVNIKNVTREINNIAAEFQISYIGIAMAGVIDQEKGMIIDGNSDFVGLPLKYLIQRETGIPTAAIHNTAALAIAEYLIGENALTSNLLFIHIEGGVGAGMVFNGFVYDGANKHAGELGNILVNIGENGDRNLNDYVSNKAFIRFARNNLSAIKSELEANDAEESDILSYEVDNITQENNLTNIDMNIVFKLLENESKLMMDFVHRGAGYLGQVLVNLSLLLNPEVIIISGKIVNYPEFMQVVKRSFYSADISLLDVVTENMTICCSSFDENTESTAGAVYSFYKMGLLPEVRVESKLDIDNIFEID